MLAENDKSEDDFTRQFDRVIEGAENTQTYCTFKSAWLRTPLVQAESELVFGTQFALH